MSHITNSIELKEAIQVLKVDQAIKEAILREQFLLTYENLKPINLIKNTLNEVASSSSLLNNIIGTVVGLGTGYVSKKIVVGASGNILRNLIGAILQFGVTNVVSHHPDTIKTIGQYIFQSIINRKEKKSK